MFAGSGSAAVLTTTDLDHVPGAMEAGVVRIAVSDGAALEETGAAQAGQD